MAAPLMHTVLPASDDQDTLAAVRDLLAGPGRIALSTPNGQITLPEHLRQILADAAAALADGQAVTVEPHRTVLTTSEAAELLGISRPTFVRLLESGKIPYTSPGRTDGSNSPTCWPSSSTNAPAAARSWTRWPARPARIRTAPPTASPRPADPGGPAHMAAFRVVLDACVMLPQTLNDLLLTVADAELYAPIWTPDLLAEVERNLHSDKFGKTPQQAARRVEQMRAAFPFAEEEARGYESLIPAMTNDSKDRHVLAAAVRANAELIVTDNLKDFPASSVEPYDLEVISPDEFLWDLFDLDPDGVLESMQTVVTRNRHPPRTLGELLESLEKLTPRFVAAVRGSFRPHDDDPIAGASPTPVLPELAEAQIAALSAEHREAYLTLRGMDAAERTRFLGHTTLARLAFDVLTSMCVDGDLRTVWPLFDRTFGRRLPRSGCTTTTAISERTGGTVTWSRRRWPTLRLVIRCGCISSVCMCGVFAPCCLIRRRGGSGRPRGWSRRAWSCCICTAPPSTAMCGSPVNSDGCIRS